eukprot:CAMPEP_0181046136 /NCGR_PEP_ID=MMETSP1070-20121207/14184_1 /TAXON_ID=265543 /ORGANISM="Minutocellus polymorphus, Strain NH13" /LENGTH=259 /DNA_ID=CAMNT_0023124719 /DNA_START=80 /DNA_END=857 /DNA_ORIENTATION=+
MSAPPANAANWTEAEDWALQDGLQTYPHTLDKNARWTSIAAGVPARSKRECVARFREIRAATIPRQAKKSAKVSAEAAMSAPPANAANWTEAEDWALQDGLQTYPHTLDKNARWTSIAAGVPARSKRECVARFREIRAALMATTGSGSGKADGDGDGGQGVETAKETTTRSEEAGGAAASASGSGSGGAADTANGEVKAKKKREETKKEEARPKREEQPPSQSNDKNAARQPPAVIQSTSPGTTPSLLIPGQAVDRSNH